MKNDIDVFPLSLAQEPFWYLSPEERVNYIYHLTGGLRFQGKINYEILLKALEYIIKRHDVLRTSFGYMDDVPSQYVHRTLDVSLYYYDEQSHGGPMTPSDWDNILLKAFLQPFDVTIPPLIRFNLFKSAANTHILFIVSHHLICDATSMDIIINDIISSYNNLSCCNSLPPDLPVKYGEISLWERKRISLNEYQSHLDYWRMQLLQRASGPWLPQLEYVSGVEPRFEAVQFTIDIELVERLRRRSAEAGATLFMILLAAVKLVIYIHTNCHSLTVGVPITDRAEASSEHIAGPFARIVIINTQFNMVNTIDSILQKIKYSFLDALSHCVVPIQVAYRELEDANDNNPLFTILVNFVIQRNVECSNIADTIIERVHFPVFDSSVPVEFRLVLMDDSIRVTLAHDATVLDQSSAEKMCSDYLMVLRQLVM